PIGDGIVRLSPTSTGNTEVWVDLDAGGPAGQTKVAIVDATLPGALDPGIDLLLG
ncbi:MAG: hypothetical protein HC881_24570, partial [Leptolyngbyaceae cyanobacterium SL_7_1]|nr:hypothetical protein [Leptolyngbyaceae cyanobacterium SL_7_1]